ncbi:hypothetical protein [Variovorax sp. W2I14]|uniref:hypothetical protein n=1 Tax=Variovorax sp. W2I14 TaxID=3042290 RepID=UPI003D1C49FE
MEGLTRWTRHALADGWWQCRRSAQRLYRMAGPDGLAILLGLLVICGLAAAVVQVREQRIGLRAMDAAAETGESLPRPVAELSNLQKFEQVLPAHDDIPEVLERLFELGVEEKLVLSRGEYRAQNDEVGQFVRYRMTMPIKGNAPAVQRFLERALAGNRSLVFESVQFKRDRIQAEQIEAIVQWTLITGWPAVPAAQARESSGMPPPMPAPLQTPEGGAP